MSDQSYGVGMEITYKARGGYVKTGKILKIRPYGIYIVGKFEGDPNTDHIQKNRIIEP